MGRGRPDSSSLLPEPTEDPRRCGTTSHARESVIFFTPLMTSFKTAERVLKVILEAGSTGFQVLFSRVTTPVTLFVKFAMETLSKSPREGRKMKIQSAVCLVAVNCRVLIMKGRLCRPTCVPASINNIDVWYYNKLRTAFTSYYLFRVT